MAEKLNIVLVHGAFADGEHWRHIIPRLHEAGHRVMAVQNRLTSLADDVANTRKLAEWIGGPTLLVGHSYGGAVVTGQAMRPTWWDWCTSPGSPRTREKA